MRCFHISSWKLSGSVSATTASSLTGYVMLLWFWGSNAKRKIFKDTRKQLAGFVKVQSVQDVLVLSQAAGHGQYHKQP